MKELIQNVFDKATKYIKEMRVGYASNRKSLSFCTSSLTSSTIYEEIFNLMEDGEVIGGSD